MEPSTLIATTAITAITSGIVGAIVAALVSSIKSHGHKAVDDSAAIKSGMRALLWRELRNIYEQAMNEGGLSTEDRTHLEGVYQSYHGLGGNGTGTRLYQDAMETKVLP